MHYMILHIKSKSPKKYPKMENWTSSFTTFPNLFLQALTKECRNMFSVYISNFLPGNGAQVPRYWKLANAMLTATLLLFLSLFLQKKSTATRISTEHLEDFFLLRNFLTPTWFSQKKMTKKQSVFWGPVRVWLFPRCLPNYPWVAASSPGPPHVWHLSPSCLVT